MPAAQAFQEVWEKDKGEALAILSRMSAVDCLALAKAVAAHQGTTVGTIFAAWLDVRKNTSHDASIIVNEC